MQSTKSIICFGVVLLGFLAQWLDPNDPDVNEVLNIEDNQMAFYNGPTGQVEWLLNRGKSSTIRIKGYDDPSILKWDLSSYKGRTVLDAELHLTLYGDSKVNALVVSTINSLWNEGTQTGGTASVGDSCWRWRTYPLDPNNPSPYDEWTFEGSDFSTASFGNFGTLTSFGYKSSDTFKSYPAGSYTRVAMKLDPSIVHAMILDNCGITVTDPRFDFTSGNPRIYSADQNPSVQPRLYIKSKIDDTTGTGYVDNLHATPGDWNGEAQLSFLAPLDPEDGKAFGYDVRYATHNDFNTARPVDRWRIPRPDEAGKLQRILIEKLTPGITYNFWIQAYDKVGNTGNIIKTDLTMPPVAPDPKFADGGFTKPDPSGKQVLGVNNVLNYWVCSELAKVNPMTGNRMEDGYTGGNDDDYKKANAVWDSQLNRVTLTTGKNEMNGFQVIIERLAGSLTGVNVNCSDLNGPFGDMIPSATHIEFFKLHYVTSSGNFYPDPAIPLASPFKSTFSVPDPDTNPNGGFQSVCCDFYVPDSAYPGIYTGVISIDCNELAQRIDIDIKLIVHDAVIPDFPSFFIDLNGYGNKWSSEASRHQVFQLCQKHRMVPNTLPYGWGEFNYNTDRAPELTGAGPTRSISNFTKFASAYGPFLDGTGFSSTHPLYPYHGPGEDTAIANFYTTFYEGWPNTLTDPTFGYDSSDLGWAYWNAKYDAGGADRQEFFLEAPDVLEAFPSGYGQGYSNVAKQFAEYAQNAGWHNTAFQVYLNNKGTYSSCISLWTLEEQYVADDFRADSWFLDLCKAGFDAAAAPDFNWRLRIDTSTRWSQNWGQLNGICNLRCQGDGKNWNYRHDRYRRFTEPMEEMRWWYGAGAEITEPLIDNCTDFLNYWSHGFDGGLPYWNCYNTNWTTADTLAVLPSGDSVPGHGYFDGRIATARMKGMRFGQQICEYLNMLASKPGWNRTLATYALHDRCGDDFTTMEILDFYRLRADLLATLSPTAPDSLFINPDNIAASAGGTVTFDLDAGAAGAWRPFYILSSITGQGPTLLPDKTILPLTIDAATYLLLQLGLPGAGTLDVDGKALTQWIIPPFAVSAGFNLYFAFVCPKKSGMGWFASNCVSLQVVP